jgi:hypothetical protein
VHLLDQLRRQPLLALDLVLVVPHCRLERSGRLYHRLGIDVGRQAAVFDYGVHRHLLLPPPGVATAWPRQIACPDRITAQLVDGESGGHLWEISRRFLARANCSAFRSQAQIR